MGLTQPQTGLRRVLAYEKSLGRQSRQSHRWPGDVARGPRWADLLGFRSSGIHADLCVAAVARAIGRRGSGGRAHHHGFRASDWRPRDRGVSALARVVVPTLSRPPERWPRSTSCRDARRPGARQQQGTRGGHWRRWRGFISRKTISAARACAISSSSIGSRRASTGGSLRCGSANAPRRQAICRLPRPPIGPSPPGIAIIPWRSSSDTWPPPVCFKRWTISSRV